MYLKALIYTLSEQIKWYVNHTSTKLLKKENRKKEGMKGGREKRRKERERREGEEQQR
jgi:hypothetical protein